MKACMKAMSLAVSQKSCLLGSCFHACYVYRSFLIPAHLFSSNDIRQERELCKPRIHGFSSVIIRHY
jgi:hypothetical protein